MFDFYSITCDKVNYKFVIYIYITEMYKMLLNSHLLQVYSGYFHHF